MFLDVLIGEFVGNLCAPDSKLVAKIISILDF